MERLTVNFWRLMFLKKRFMSLREFDELEEQKLTRENKWWWILKLITTVLTAVLTTLGVTSCVYA